MKKSSIVAVLVVAAFVVGGIAYWYLIPNKSYAPASSELANPVASAPQTPPTASSVTVTYTSNGFSPATVTVPKGGAVVFKNATSDGMWVASNPHPVHTGYPTRGGCIASTFDACKSIPAGGSWSFTFNIAGTWGYHDHLNPGEGGTVIVR